MRLGIDFGTTRTVVARVGEDGRYPVVGFRVGDELRDHLPGGASAMASALSFGALGHGDELGAVSWATTSVKRLLGEAAPDEPVVGFDGTSHLALVTGYLAWVRQMLLGQSTLADELDSEAPLEAMVAVPAQASTRQRYVTLEAYRRAGFEVLGVVAEPTAAAIEFAHHNRNAVSARSPKEYVVVYDLGGGTFDTAAVSLVERRFDLLASDGVSRLGGADFDEQIVGRALCLAGLDPATIDPVARVVILERAREAKEGLRAASRKLLVDLAPVHEPVVLDVADVYADCESLISRTLEKVEQILAVLESRGIDVEDARKLGALYLVGGSSAFVPVARMLRARYGRKILLAPQPHAATAVGLAVAADPAAGVFVREAPTRVFGVWREADRGHEKVFDPILRKDQGPTVGAVVVERRYRPTHSIGHLRFLECSGLGADGTPIGDLTPWEEIRFPYEAELVERADLGEVPIERRERESDAEIVETYTRGADGTIHVAIENRSGGYRRTWDLGTLR